MQSTTLNTLVNLRLRNSLTLKLLRTFSIRARLITRITPSNAISCVQWTVESICRKLRSMRWLLPHLASQPEDAVNGAGNHLFFAYLISIAAKVAPKGAVLFRHGKTAVNT
ncbi:MAG TPA: hypothetical protein VI753_17255 [Anaerolineales bacterium]|nr:hypothetical protein [Anaerolineales bacterium]